MKGSRASFRSESKGSAPRPAQGGSPSRAAVGNQALQRHLRAATAGASQARATFTVGMPHEASEREADRAAGAFAAGSGARAAASSGALGPAGSGAGTLGRAMGSSGAPLNEAVRAEMEGHFGTDLSHVRVHTGPAADGLAHGLGARAFTHGADIVFASGNEPGANRTTAHELAHVVQQTAGGPNRWGLAPRSEPDLVQRDLAGSFAVPSGAFDIDLHTVNGGAVAGAQTGMFGTLRFIPGTGAPNSNTIAFSQIARILNSTGGDVGVATIPPAAAPRGPVNPPLTARAPGVRTEADPARGVDPGFFSDVEHQSAATPPVPAAPGSALSPRYPFLNGAPGNRQVPGFKRSDDPADIRSAEMSDFPNFPGVADFSFESVVLGEDTQVTYGAVNWGFGVRTGTVVNERINVVAGHSATFDEALERHRDFYVHEPVTFYFDFDSSVLSPSEEAKIGAFAAYLARNPDIHMDLEGFADLVGGNGAYNRDLSLRRAEAVKAALLAHGIREENVSGPVVLPEAHVSALTQGHGASTDATLNAGTGDQGGNAAVGGDQKREANRWANRRVVLTFRHATAANP